MNTPHKLIHISLNPVLIITAYDFGIQLNIAHTSMPTPPK